MPVMSKRGRIVYRPAKKGFEAQCYICEATEVFEILYRGEHWLVAHRCDGVRAHAAE